MQKKNVSELKSQKKMLKKKQPSSRTSATICVHRSMQCSVLYVRHAKQTSLLNSRMNIFQKWNCPATCCSTSLMTRSRYHESAAENLRFILNHAVQKILLNQLCLQ